MQPAMTNKYAELSFYGLKRIFGLRREVRCRLKSCTEPVGVACTHVAGVTCTDCRAAKGNNIAAKTSKSEKRKKKRGKNPLANALYTAEGRPPAPGHCCHRSTW